MSAAFTSVVDQRLGQVDLDVPITSNIIFSNMVFVDMVDRERELRALRKRLSSDSFELIILYVRRYGRPSWS